MLACENGKIEKTSYQNQYCALLLVDMNFVSFVLPSLGFVANHDATVSSILSLAISILYRLPGLSVEVQAPILCFFRTLRVLLALTSSMHHQYSSLVQASLCSDL